MSRFKEGDRAWIIESNRIIREVGIMRVEASFYVVFFRDTSGAIRVRGSRLFATKEEAEKSLKLKVNV